MPMDSDNWICPSRDSSISFIGLLLGASLSAHAGWQENQPAVLEQLILFCGLAFYWSNLLWAQHSKHSSEDTHTRARGHTCLAWPWSNFSHSHISCHNLQTKQVLSWRCPFSIIPAPLHPYTSGQLLWLNNNSLPEYKRFPMRRYQHSVLLCL